MSTIIAKLLKELEQEAQTTRKMLSLVPEKKYSWKPHEKSMTVIRLATHIAELPGWVEMTLKTEELDFANNPYKQEQINNNQDLLNYFESSLAKANTALQSADEPALEGIWVLREGEQVYSRSTKYEVIRMALAQIIHHRAQLGVFLRLLNIPIPGSYGPSADDQGF
ncbi:DinB family protein [Desertivirga arenae]|uniref:DinB family protein n=1 Tax=Desertivirga arenae TaxID=2810309 RepID=UPI001A96E63B|nr:DinB family protein [Pedobacter sp. SYSU D00823]